MNEKRKTTGRKTGDKSRQHGAARVNAEERSRGSGAFSAMFPKGGDCNGFSPGAKICGTYGSYELVRADRENTDKYFEACLDIVCADELCEAWQLYRMSMQDVLKKVLSLAEHGRGEAYFLLFHDPFSGVRVVGLGGVSPLGDLGGMAAEIWFAGESLANHKRFLAEHAKGILAAVLQKHPVLLNICAGWNFQAVCLAKYLGFCVEKDFVRAGRDRALFRRFYLTKASFEEKHNKKLQL